jgi:hypothetical protein
MLLVFGLTLVGCENPAGGDDDPITVAGTAKTGDADVALVSGNTAVNVNNAVSNVINVVLTEVPTTTPTSDNFVPAFKKYIDDDTTGSLIPATFELERNHKNGSVHVYPDCGNCGGTKRDHRRAVGRGSRSKSNNGLHCNGGRRRCRITHRYRY